MKGRKGGEYGKRGKDKEKGYGYLLSLSPVGVFDINQTLCAFINVENRKWNNRFEQM
jgi:hypothetical protein